MNTVVPLLACIISFVFALAVLDQFFAHRRPHQAVWIAGLLVFGVATGSEFWVGAFGLNVAAYRLWYLFGAIFAAAYLGMGTVYLLAPRWIAHRVMAILIVMSIYAIFRVFSAEVNLDVLVPGETLSGEALPGGATGPRFLTPFFNVFGTIALVGGAIYSATVYWRRKIMSYRVVSNMLIAVGALLPAVGGALARGGSPNFLYFSELLGVAIIFLGFLRSREIFGLYRFPLIHGFRRI